MNVEISAVDLLQDIYSRVDSGCERVRAEGLHETEEGEEESVHQHPLRQGLKRQLPGMVLSIRKQRLEAYIR